MSASTSEHSLRAQMAAAERWGRIEDRAAATAPARAGLRAKFAREVDPDGELPPDQLERRVDSLVHAHMLKMSYKAKVARRKAREAREASEAADQAEDAALRAAEDSQ